MLGTFSRLVKLFKIWSWGIVETSFSLPITWSHLEVALS
jgi:hypothetical protein